MTLAEWLTVNKVKSFGPQTGIMLVGIRETLFDALKNSPPESVLVGKQARAYLRALKVICIVGLAHQGQIIAELGAAIEGAKRDYDESQQDLPTP